MPRKKAISSDRLVAENQRLLRCPQQEDFETGTTGEKPLDLQPAPDVNQRRQMYRRQQDEYYWQTVSKAAAANHLHRAL